MVSGKDKGKQGKVIKSFPRDGSVVVENINVKKKHQKPKSAGKKGEKIEVSRPVAVSSVMLICKNCNKPTRVGYKLEPDGSKLRVCKKCNAAI